MTPQLPQNIGSVDGTAQAPPQFVCPVAQPAWQVPFAHAGVAPPHVVPQAPQFCGLVIRFTHAPLQLVVPAGHAQSPETHASVAPQASPQPPQLSRSVSSRTHIPSPAEVPTGQLSSHSPPRQTCPGMQAVLQPPQ
jgi:hypothetical protein